MMVWYGIYYRILLYSIVYNGDVTIRDQAVKCPHKSIRIKFVVLKMSDDTHVRQQGASGRNFCLCNFSMFCMRCR